MDVVSEDQYGKIRRFRFGNGLTLLTKVCSDLPIVSFRGCVRGGAYLESEKHAGLAKMLCLLLKAGTPQRSAVSIAEALDFMGTALRFSAGHDAIHMTLSCLSKHWEKSLEIAEDLWLHSDFPHNEMERLRRTALAELKRKADQPGLVAADRFQEAAYGDHPYHRSIDGYESTLTQLSQNEIASLYKEHLDPSRIIITVVGDIEEDQLVAWVGNRFHALRESDTRPELCEIIQKTTGGTFLVDRDISQAHICMGNLAARRSAEDHYASLLMNYILGGSGLTSRLTHRIRTEKGLAYSVYSSMNKRLLSGTFSVTMQTKADRAGAAVQTICDELRRIQKELVTDDEIRDAKSFFKGYFPFRIETVENEAAYIEMSEFHGLGLDYLDRETERIEQVSKEDIRQAAQKYVEPETFVLAVTGPQKQLKNQFQ